jgi:predicted membrane protein
MNFFSTLSSEVLDAIGVAGFGLYVLNYSLLTVQRVQSHQICYFVINGLAAAMVLVGLMSTFNLASALIQIFWIFISITAIIIRIRKRTDPIFTHQPQP